MNKSVREQEQAMFEDLDVSPARAKRVSVQHAEQVGTFIRECSLRYIECKGKVPPQDFLHHFEELHNVVMDMELAAFHDKYRMITQRFNGGPEDDD